MPKAIDPANLPTVRPSNSFVHKILASLLISIQERVRQVRRVVLTLATPVQLKCYSIDAGLCVLVSGPFANLSEDLNHVVNLIVHEKAATWLEKR